MTTTTTTASAIFALAMGTRCEGPERCHYCGAPCGRDTPHVEPQKAVGVRAAGTTSKLPGAQYMCRGCSCWHRRKVTAAFLGGGVQDGRQASWHSWLVTPGIAWALQRSSGPKLYEKLMKAPCRFFLAIIDGEKAPDNLLHLAIANDNAEVTAQTPLHMTLNNSVMTFTIYELQQAVRGDVGLELGVRALVRLFGRPPAELVAPTELPEEEREAKRGRPFATDPREKTAREVVRRSGIA